MAVLVGSLAPAFAEPEPPVRAEGGGNDEGADPPIAPPGDTPPTSPTPAPLAPKRKRGTFTIGAGYSTDDGFGAHANLAQDDLFGTGKHLSLNAALTGRRQLLVTRYRDPSLFGSSRLSFTADLFADVRRLPGLWRKSAGASATLGYKVNPHLQAFVTYRFEDITAEPTQPYAQRGGERPFLGNGRIGAVRAGLVYDDRDHPWFARRGTQLGASVERVDRAFGAHPEHERLRYDVWANHHAPLGPLTLHVGGRASLIRQASGPVPLSERLYLDGSSDLRGYAPGALAPHGGDAKLTGSAELEAPLVPRLGLSAIGFVDGGMIADGANRYSGASAGVGVLWRSPLGPIRVDYALPLDGGAPGFVLNLGGNLP